MSTRTRLILGAICVIYIAARLWRLDASCLWFDEIFSVHAAEHSWNTLLWFVAQDLIHPPLFYVLLKGWIGVGGESVVWLRLFPVLFSVLAIFPFFRLCRELKLPDSVTLLSLGLLAVNGSLIKYTQTLRMYSMLMFLALLSMWLFARYFNRGKSFVPLVIVNLLLIYTHYFGWLVVGTEVLAILVFQRIKWRRAAVMSGILFTAFVPWIWAIWKAAQAGSDVAQNISWMTRPGLREMMTFVLDLTEPFYFQASNAEPASIYRVSIPILLIIITAFGFFLADWKKDEDKRVLYLVGLFAIFPAVVAFIVSWVLPHSVWGTRHLIVIYGPAAILIAFFVTRLPIDAVRIGAITLLILLSGYAFLLQLQRETPRYVWCGWNDVAAEIKNSNEPRAKIYAFENLVAYHLWFALRDSEEHQVSVVKGVDVRTDDETYFLPRGFDSVETVPIQEIDDGAFWLAFRTSSPGDFEPIIKAFADRQYGNCMTEPEKVFDYGPTKVYAILMTKGLCK